MNISSIDYPVMEAYIAEYPSRYPSPNYDEMRLDCADGFLALSRQDIVGVVNAGLTGTQINRVLDLAQFPLTKRAIDPGLYTVVAQQFEEGQKTKALPILQDTAESELGIFFFDVDGKATFHDRDHRWSSTRSLISQAIFEDEDGANIFYEDLVHDFGDGKLVNTWIVSPDPSVPGGLPQVARDVVSEHRFWPVADDLNTKLDSNGAALEIAQSLLNQTAEPVLRFERMVVKPYSTAVWQTCLSLRISDRITIIRKPIIAAGGTNIQMDCFIEGISWSLTGGGEWTVTFQLSPVSSQQWYRSTLRAKPVSYYRLNSTTSMKDEMQLNPGTLSGTPSLFPGNLINDLDQGTRFQIGDSFTILDSPSISLPVGVSGGMAIECMVYLPSAPGSTLRVVGKAGSYLVEARADKKLQFTLTNGGNTVTVVSTTVLQLDTWYYCAFVYNGDYSGVQQFGLASAGSLVTGVPGDYYHGAATSGTTYNLLGSRYQCFEEGVLTSLEADLTCVGDASLAEYIRAAAFESIAGPLPGPLLAESADLRLGVGTKGVFGGSRSERGFVTFPLVGTVYAGYFYLSLLGGESSNVVAVGYESSGGNRSYKRHDHGYDSGTAAPTSGSPDPFGTPAGSDSVRLAIRANYNATKRTGEEGKALIYLNGQLDASAAYTGGVADTTNDVLGPAVGVRLDELIFHARKLNGVYIAEKYASR